VATSCSASGRSASGGGGGSAGGAIEQRRDGDPARLVRVLGALQVLLRPRPVDLGAQLPHLRDGARLIADPRVLLLALRGLEELLRDLHRPLKGRGGVVRLGHAVQERAPRVLDRQRRRLLGPVRRADPVIERRRHEDLRGLHLALHQQSVLDDERGATGAGRELDLLLNLPQARERDLR
jgi:hypothetical protein